MKKKSLIIIATVFAGMAFTSCGSSKESAYRKAYEKAKAQDQTQTVQPVQAAEPVVQAPEKVQQPAEQAATQSQQQNPVVTPLVEAPADQNPQTDSHVTVRSEKVDIVKGDGLKAYSVVVGSFGVRANAEGLQNTLKSAGYDAQVAFNKDRNMYRVVISTFDTREAAIQSRNSIQSTYKDAWLLMKQ